MSSVAIAMSSVPLEFTLHHCMLTRLINAMSPFHSIISDHAPDNSVKKFTTKITKSPGFYDDTTPRGRWWYEKLWLGLMPPVCVSADQPHSSPIVLKAVVVSQFVHCQCGATAERTTGEGESLEPIGFSLGWMKNHC